MRKSSIFILGIPMMGVVSGIMAMHCFGQASVSYQKVALQTIDGFGASNAFFVGGDTSGTNAPDIADFYSTFTPAQQSEVLNALYSQTSGAGLSILRMRIDPAIEATSGTYQWSTANENANFAESAMGLGVSNVWAASWTPPSWMKSNDSNDNGGSLLAANYGAYASYLSAYYNQMVNVYGIPLSHIAIQNEPDRTQAYESCVWSSQNFHDFLARSGFSTFPSNFFVLPELSYWSDSYAGPTLEDSATLPQVGIVSAHAYSLAQDGFDYTPFTDATNDDKHVWETEVSDLDAEDGSITNALAYGQNIHNSIVLGGVSAWHYWWGFEIYGRTNQERADGQSLILYDATTSTFTYKKSLYAVGNFARFVRPGFQQMSLSSNTPASGVFLSAFANSSTGEVVLVAINTNTTTSAVTVNNLPLGVVNPYLTSATANLQQQASITVANGNLPMSLQAQSITTFDGFYASGPASGTYNIQNVNSGDLLDVAGASILEGAQVIQYTANGGSNQLWTISSSSNGTYTISNVNSGLYLAVSSSSTTSGADVIQWASNGGQNEEWYIYETPAGSWIFINANSGMKLAIGGASISINASAIQYTDDGSSSELWNLVQDGNIPTTTTLSTSSITYGQSASVVVTVAPTTGSSTPTGTVTLTMDGTTAQTGTLSNGRYAFTVTGLQAGPHYFMATYAPATGYGLSSTSSNTYLTVNQATLTVTGECANRTFGQANSCDAPAITGYQYTDSASTVFAGTPASTAAAARDSVAGTYAATPVSASLSLTTFGSTNYGVSPANGTFVISGGASQFVLFTQLPNLAHGSSYQLTARTSSGLAVAYIVTVGNSIASVSGDVLTISGSGTVTVQAEQSTDPTGDYAPATPVSVTFTAQ